MTNKSSLTITLASNKYGYGHFKRMFNFKTKLANHNIKNYITHFDNYNLFLNKKKISINYLSNYNLKISDIKEKLKIETLWNELIYKKFINQIQIDKKEIRKKIEKICIFLRNRHFI